MSSDAAPSPIDNQFEQVERSPATTSSDDSIELEDPFRRLHHHDYITCISDRVDQHLIFPFIQDGTLLDDIVETIVGGTSVIVVGEPGIGKRTLSLGLARRLHEMRESGTECGVSNRAVFTLSLGREFWSQTEQMTRSAIQDRIRHVFRLVEKAGPENLLFCIDDVDVLSFVDQQVLKERPLSVRDNSEPVLSTENMLRFLLFNKKVLCLCTCISDAYDRLIALDTYYDEKFSESFRVFRMQPPPLKHSFNIVRAHRERIEAELDVIIRPEAVDAAVACAVTFLTHRSMPEKALDLLHEASTTAVKAAELVSVELRASLHVGGRIIVDKHHVGTLIKDWCGVSEEQLKLCYKDDRFSL